MNILSITVYHIIFAGLGVILLYSSAIAILYKNKSGLLPYLAILFFPIIGSLGIILGNLSRQNRMNKLN